MGISLKDFASFAEGAIERDRELTKENLEIRNANLVANRDFLIDQKKKKYEAELKAFEDEDKKVKAIKATNLKFSGQEISPSDWGSTYLKEYKPDLYASILKLADGDTDLANSYFAKEYSPELVNFSATTTRDKLDSKIADEVKAITSDYAEKIKNAKGDSFLINQLLGKKNKEINQVVTNVEESSKGVEQSEIVTKEVESTEKKELPFTIKDETLSFTVPKKFRDKIEPIREKLNNDDSKKGYTKTAILATQKFFNDNDVAKIKQFIVKDKETDEITGFKGPASSVNNHITLLADGAVSSISNYEIYTKTGKDSSLITNEFNPTTISNIVDDRVRNYTNISQNKNIFSDRENIVGIVPFSIVDTNNTLGNLTFNSKADKKAVGESYIKALKVLNSELNPNGAVEGNQKFMNDLQSELLSLKGGTNKTANLVKLLMIDDLTKQGIGVAKSETSTNENVVGKIIITDPKSGKKSEPKDDTEANRKLAEEKGFTIEVFKKPEEPKKIKSDIQSKAGAERASDEQMLDSTAIERLTNAAEDGTISDEDLLTFGDMVVLNKVPRNLRTRLFKLRMDRTKKENEARKIAFNEKVKANRNKNNLVAELDTDE